MFGVEALKNSQEFSKAHYNDVNAVQGATIEKETFLANLGPLADVLDQYACVCNEVISLFAHVILRLLETINNTGSPVEIFIILSCAAFIIIIKQISVIQVSNASIRFIVLNCRRLTDIVHLHFYPLIVNVLRLLFLPIKFLWDICTSFIGMILISKSKRLRRQSSNCGADDVSRITCCICFIREKSILLQPCNHICVCAHCVEELLDTYEEPLCPLCRSVITSYVDVYI